MKQKEVFNKIGGIIKELNEQYNYLQADAENLNELELELFISNARFLTDHIEILCKLNLQNSHNQVAPATEEHKPEQNYFEPIVHKGGHEEPEPAGQNQTDTGKIEDDSETSSGIDLGEAAPADTYSYMRQEPEVIRHELVLDESVNWEDDDEDPVEKIPPPQSLREKTTPVAADSEYEKPAKKILSKISSADKQAGRPVNNPEEKEIVTINQKISAQLESKAEHTAHLTAAPLSDVKQGINLNDKLLFVKDLFNGYSLAYAEVIDILNRFGTFEEAITFLNKNYAGKNSWESKPETVEKFYAILRKRYV